MPSEYTAGYLELLKMADARLLLDSETVDKILTKNNVFTLPVRSGDGRSGFEYALILDVKLNRPDRKPDHEYDKRYFCLYRYRR